MKRTLMAVAMTLCLALEVARTEPLPDRHTLALWRFDESRPELLWDHAFGGDQVDYLSKAILSRDGSYLIAGYTTIRAGYSGDYFVMKLSLDGEETWSTIAGRSNLSEISHDILELPNGNIAIVGGYGDGNPTHPCWWELMLFSANGDSLWSRSYEIGNIGHCDAIIPAEDGGFLLAGSGGNMDDIHLRVIKTDDAGEPAWTRTYGEDDSTAEVLFDAMALPGEGYILCGKRSHDQDYTTAYAYISRIDLNGDVVWELNATNDDRYEWGTYCRTVHLTDEGIIGVGNWSRNHSSQNSWTNPWMVCLSLEGEIKWEYIGDTLGLWDSMTETLDGEYVMTGSMGPTVQRMDMGIIKVSKEQETVWTKWFGGVGNEYSYEILRNPDGGYALFGLTGVGGVGQNSNYQAYILRTTPDLSLSTDLSGNMHGCEMFGNISRSDGRWGDALLIDPEQGGYAKVSDDSLLHPSQFTLETWFRVNEEPPNRGVLMAKQFNEDAPSYLLFCDRNAVGFELTADGQTYAVSYANEGIAGAWHYIACSYDGNFMRLFLDSELVDSTSVGAAIQYNESPIIIGNGAEDVNGDLQFRGQIDEMRISDFAIHSLDANLFAPQDTVFLFSDRIDSTISVDVLVVNQGNSPTQIEMIEPEEDSPFRWTPLNNHELHRGDTLNINVEYNPVRTGRDQEWMSVLYPENDVYILIVGECGLSVESENKVTPKRMGITSAFPNPFNSSTTITYSLPTPGRYAIDVIDIQGRLVTRLSDGWREAGSYREVFEGNGLVGGVYFIQLDSGTLQLTTKVILGK